jgi:16S rRNA (adenine1518-N6/adenine1519-N6)-dimethyltransferase
VTAKVPVPSLAAIRAQLAADGAAPQRSYGQHFLADPAVLERIADLAELNAGDAVLEVGPGPGVLTATLLNRGARVVAVEADARMVRVLRAMVGEPAPPLAARRELAAFAGVDAAALARRYAFVANLPYQIASSLIVDVFAVLPPRRAVLMVQREVADRMRAKPGSDDYGALSVLIGCVAEVREAFRLRPGAFWPPPKVDSSCIVVTPHPEVMVTPENFPSFAATVRRSFQERRKTMRNTLGRASPLPRAELERVLNDAGIDPETRAERLAVQDFVRLDRALARAEPRGAAGV